MGERKGGRRMGLRWACLLAVACMATACVRSHPVTPSTPQTRVQYRAVADKHLKHYTMTSSQSAIAPDPQPDNPAPAYPSDLVTRNLSPMTVTALLIVDAKGRVQETRIAGEASDDAVRRRFDAAVREATMQWRFTPMRIANWVEDENGDAHRVSAEPKPFSQTYRFRFEVHDGKPQVNGVVPSPQR